MSDANHNQSGLNPSQSEYVQSVFAFQMEPIDPALTAGQSNTTLRPTVQPSPSQSIPSNLGPGQNSNLLPNFPPPDPSHHSMLTSQNNANMSIMGNGTGMAPAQGLAFNPQSPSVCFQHRPQSSAGQPIATTQANLHHNMVNMGAQQTTQQPQPLFNDYMDYVNLNADEDNLMGFPQQTPVPTPMLQHAHHHQPGNEMANQYLGQVPSSFDFSTIPGAASHYNIGSFHHNNNSSFHPNSMPSLQSEAAQPPVTPFSANALSRAAETMNSQVAAETARKGASKSATSQTPDKPQEANPAQPAKRKRTYAPRKPKVEGTSDPTAPKEPPKKRQRTHKKKTETIAPIGPGATAPVALMAVMPTATSTPTIAPALLSTTDYYEASPATPSMRSASEVGAASPFSGLKTSATMPAVEQAIMAIGTFQPTQSFVQTAGSATFSPSAPHKQVAHLSSQPPIFNMATPLPSQIPSEFAVAAKSAPIPALRSAPPVNVINQTPVTGIKNTVSAVPTKIPSVPVPNIPNLAKVPCVFPRQAPGTTPSTFTVAKAPASTQAFAPRPARTPAPGPTPAPTPTPTPRVSPQHPVQPLKQDTVGASVQRATNAAFTPSPSPAPARLPAQSSAQRQIQLPPKPSTFVAAQAVGQQPAQQAVHQHAQQPVQYAVQRQAAAIAQQQAHAAAQNRVSAQPALQHSYQHAVQLPAKPQAQQQVQQKAQQQQAKQQFPQQAQQQVQQQAQRQAQQQTQNVIQIPAQQTTQTPTGPTPNPSTQPTPVPSFSNVNTEGLARPVTPTIISPQADTDLYCVFGMHTLHHFRVRRSTLKHLHQPTTLTTSPFPNSVYINFNEALTTPGGTPTELSNAPGETADSHMQAFGRVLKLLEDPATQGKTACDVDTIWRLSNLQPALGLDKEYVNWLRRCMGLFIGQVTLPVSVPATTTGANGGNTQMGKDLFEERDMRGADLKKNKWEKALEACRKFTWIVQWRTLVARLAYLCSVDKDAGGRFVLKKPGGSTGGAGGGGVLNRLLVGEETIDAIVNTRTKACHYLTNVAETTCKNWHSRIKNGQRNGGCRRRMCMEKRMAGLTQVVKGLGLHIPKETTTNMESTFYGQGTKLTIGLSIHSVFDILKAIEHERRGRYRFADAMIQQFGGKCYDCMKGSAFGPGEFNPTNSLFPIIDLLYEMLWELRVKLLEWTEFPWAEKIVLTLKGVEGFESEKM